MAILQIQPRAFFTAAVAIFNARQHVSTAYSCDGFTPATCKKQVTRGRDRCEPTLLKSRYSYTYASSCRGHLHQKDENALQSATKYFKINGVGSLQCCQTHSATHISAAIDTPGSSERLKPGPFSPSNGGQREGRGSRGKGSIVCRENSRALSFSHSISPAAPPAYRPSHAPIRAQLQQAMQQTHIVRVSALRAQLQVRSSGAAQSRAKKRIRISPALVRTERASHHDCAHQVAALSHHDDCSLSVAAPNLTQLTSRVPSLQSTTLVISGWQRVVREDYCDKV